jgi:hypothetical protein
MDITSKNPVHFPFSVAINLIAGIWIILIELSRQCILGGLTQSIRMEDIVDLVARWQVNNPAMVLFSNNAERSSNWIVKLVTRTISPL